MDVWERSFNETQILDAEKFEVCKRYIERNPVRKRMVEKVEDFPFSSASRLELLDERPRWFDQAARG